MTAEALAEFIVLEFSSPLTLGLALDLESSGTFVFKGDRPSDVRSSGTLSLMHASSSCVDFALCELGHGA